MRDIQLDEFRLEDSRDFVRGVLLVEGGEIKDRGLQIEATIREVMTSNNQEAAHTTIRPEISRYGDVIDALQHID